MAEAEVGDEQHFGDPTVNALCERVAELLGFEAAVFLPSGTMCNAIGFRLHIRAGRRRGLPAPHLAPDQGRGRRPGGDLRRGAVPAGGRARDVRRRHAARRPCARRTTATARAPGSCRSSRPRTWPAATCGRSPQLREVVEVAKANGLRLHMDGARLMNAVVASGVPTTEWTAGFDTAWIDFSKGLGAPMGAVLAGSRELIDEAWRYKQMMRRRAAPGGHRRRRRAVGARPPRRAARDGPRQRAHARARAWREHPRHRASTRRGRHQHRHLPSLRRPRAVHPARRRTA